MTETIRLRACVAVAHDGRILLVPHANSDACNIQWNLPGEQVAFGERLQETAVREAAEETGLAVRITGLLDVSEVIIPERPWHGVTVAFRGELAAESGHRYGEKAPRWFSPGELVGVACHPWESIDEGLWEG